MNVSLAPLTLVLLTLVLAGCSTTTGIAVTDDDVSVVPVEAAEPSAVCGVWLSIGWSVDDTPLTIAEVKANNRARGAWCPA